MVCSVGLSVLWTGLVELSVAIVGVGVVVGCGGALVLFVGLFACVPLLFGATRWRGRVCGSVVGEGGAGPVGPQVTATAPAETGTAAAPCSPCGGGPCGGVGLGMVGPEQSRVGGGLVVRWVRLRGAGRGVVWERVGAGAGRPAGRAGLAWALCCVSGCGVVRGEGAGGGTSGHDSWWW